MHPENSDIDHVADSAKQSAQQAIKSTQGMVNSALNSVAGTAHDLRDSAVPLHSRNARILAGDPDCLGARTRLKARANP